MYQFEMAMISASALQGVKLRATDEEARRDRSAPNVSLIASEDANREKEETRRDYFFSTGLDRWYASLKDKTFRSEMVELSPSEARAIVSCWEKGFKHKDSNAPLPDESQIEIPAVLKGLADRLSSSISSLSPEKGAFIKLSTRSPKDSHIAFANARREYESLLSSKGENVPVNDKLIHLAEVVIESLRVRTGEYAIKLLLSSDRVGEDLEYALEKGDDDFTKCICLILREWVDIPQWAEFRGFVWSGQLTAIGQYNHLVMFPQLKQQEARVRTDLESFYASIKDQIPLDRYIIDFAWTEEKVYLTEVNPFDGELVFPASTGLWSWETDRNQMKNGPLELRIREKQEETHILKHSIDPRWRAIVLS